MTSDEINALKPGYATDVLIHERVLGFSAAYQILPPYTGLLSDAGRVYYWLTGCANVSIHSGPGKKHLVVVEKDNVALQAIDASLCMAICKAALLFREQTRGQDES